MSKVTKVQEAAWKEITTKPYSDQAIWFLNGFWDELSGEAENFWVWAERFASLDGERKASGYDLDEFWSHKFLESLGETQTVIQLREKLRTIDVDSNRRMSIIEYLMFRYSKSVQQVLDAPQGDNKAQIDEAQGKVEGAQRAVEEMVKRLEEQKAAAAQARESADASAAAAQAAAEAETQATARLAEATAAAEDAATKLAEARRTESEAAARAAEAKAAADSADAVAAPYRAAVAENDAALKELQAQEASYEKKKTDLEAAIKTGGLVQRNRAANELEQLKAEDPLPLRRAKINQTATLKKMEKSAAPFNEASAKANAAKEASEEASRAAAAAAQSSQDAADVSAAAAKASEEAAEHARAERQNAEDAAAAAQKAADDAAEAAKQVESAVAEAENMLQEAVAFLEQVKKSGGVAHGAIWWMERQIAEKQKYLPAKNRK